MPSGSAVGLEGREKREQQFSSEPGFSETPGQPEVMFNTADWPKSAQESLFCLQLVLSHSPKKGKREREREREGERRRQVTLPKPVTEDRIKAKEFYLVRL